MQSSHLRIKLSGKKIGFSTTKQEVSWIRMGIVEMTEPRYDMMLARQGGVCEICGNPPKVKRLAVDHDPDTGYVRGLLCNPCNRQLVSRRSTGLLRSAADYLERSN